MNKVFYNEIDPYASEWLKNLSAKGLIAEGRVDARSIADLRPSDCEGTQAHFFAGIGVWSRALRLAGWSDDTPVWTGSCPCQPFSTAGRRKGKKDARHLWPKWFKLIEKCRPAIIFGEQVASPDGLGWLDAVFADLEGAGYACGASDLCAAGVGAPHIRQRLYFVAVAGQQRRKGKRVHILSRESRQAGAETARRRTVDSLGDSRSAGGGGDSRTILGAQTQSRREGIAARRVAHESLASSSARELGDSSGERSSLGPRPEERFGAVRYEGKAVTAPGVVAGFWHPAEWWLCRDGKARPAEPGTFPLVDGAPARVGRLRAYGNAIVAQQAALFIRAVMPLIEGCR